MERLITLLAGLIIGLRGARRKALEEVLDSLRIEQEMTKDDLDHAQKTVERLSLTLNTVQKDLTEEYQETERLKGRIKDLQGWNTALTVAPPCGKWTLEVRRRILFDFKILSVKAVRIVTGCSLREAKDWVEARALSGETPNADTWVVLSDSVTDHGLAEAMNTLLREAQRWNNPAAKPTYPQDVMFHRTAKEI